MGMRRRARLFSIVAVAVVAASCAPPPPSGGGEPTVSCVAVISADVRLSADPDCDEVDWTVLPGVVVDLNGFTVRGPGGCFIPDMDDFPRCSIILGKGAQLEDGVLAGASVLSNGGRLARMTVDSAGVEVRAFADVFLEPGSSLLDSEIRSSRVHSAYGTITVRRTNFTASSLGVGFTQSLMTDMVIEDNRFVNGGIRLAGGCDSGTVEDPLLTGSLKRNVVIDSPGIGIEVNSDSVGLFEVRDNTVVGAGGDGIRIDARTCGTIDGPIIVGGNAVSDNAGYGLRATAVGTRILDAGGNTASGNAVEPQCVGVVCTGH